MVAPHTQDSHCIIVRVTCGPALFVYFYADGNSLSPFHYLLTKPTHMLVQSTWPTTTEAYKTLKHQIDTDEQFCFALETSLMIAQHKAWSSLNRDLWYAIDNVFEGMGWPSNPDDYLEYVARYLVLIPNEEDDPDYPDAWTSDGTGNGYNQKVYDLLCQFYFLVNQPLPTLGITMQQYKQGDFVFAEWLREFANDWGAFLDTEESLPISAMASFIANPMYNIPWYADNAKGWTTFNKFFYRQFNGANEKGQTPLRPIAEPDNNNAIVSAADCTYKAEYPIDKDGNVLGIDGAPTAVTLKETHTVYTVHDLLQDAELAKHFHGGTFVHYFLNPFDYHRFHAPVKGKVMACKAVPGQVYLDVNLTSEGQFDAPDTAEGGYEFRQARGVFVVDGGDPVGMVAAIPIGMAQVSGVLMNHGLTGQHVAKGDEFGQF